MIYVGIDVAKDKHDCCILGPEAEMLYPVFTIPNDKVGFNELFSKIEAVTADKGNIKVGLEATGHYSNNLLGALVDKGFPTSIINPLHTNLYRKGLSLRKTKTDKVDARSIAMMLMTDKTLKPYSTASFHNEDLKALTRYRFDKVHERAKLRSSLARLVNILFPELEKLVPTLHMASVYALLEEFPELLSLLKPTSPISRKCSLMHPKVAIPEKKPLRSAMLPETPSALYPLQDLWNLSIPSI